MLDYNFAFILGNPRSGTSLLRLMLNAHKNIIAPPECGFMQWWHKKYCYWEEGDNFSKQLDEFIEDLFTSKKIETWNIIASDLKEYIQKKRPKNYNELSACVYLTYGTKRKHAKCLIDKNNYYIQHLELLTEMWPKAKFIHLIRDGRDVACSYRGVNKLETKSAYKPILPQKIEDIAEEWVQNNMLINQLSTKYEYLLIRYEDLLNDSKNSMIKICEYLGLSFDSQMLSYYESKEKFLTEPEETLDWKQKTKEKPDSKRIGQYHSALNEVEVAIFESIAAKELKKYGYNK
ncbi:MAG: sulfotransferase [Vicingaceae bacterium]